VAQAQRVLCLPPYLADSAPRPRTMPPAKKEQIQRAIAQLSERAPIPTIDFTQHALDDGTSVSTQERIVKDVRPRPSIPPHRTNICSMQVQAPAMTLPTDAQFFSREDPSKPDINFLKNHFYREGRLSEEHALYILDAATAVLRAEPNLLYVDAPITGAC
jgi:serine/threonine-protein phosphatase 2B catalytic subunit